ncbi:MULTISPECIES: hypothetical protein [Liquorilactobacillus]|uniref:hypothetical protein n=1 Tax=Liquorilactobacillus TaxID=2767888 RepID=UPI0021C25919|nr:hypothetical protein [Liquorilactobacillus satsumensis]MCP9328869.1 hypothetical protein [Liquorilactobacillus satsumensis]
MEYSIFTIRVAEMLLMPIDSQMLAGIYEKAPKKKMASVAKKISDRMREKIIGNLLDRGNVAYTVSQIINGKVDRFYKINNFNIVIKDISYSGLQELIQHHDSKAGAILLTMLKNYKNKAIEVYIGDAVTNIEDLHEAWKKIDWSVNNKPSISQDNLVEDKLNSEIIRLTKANSKLKEKFNQAKKQHNNEIEQLTNKFKKQLAEQAEFAIKERKQKIDEMERKYGDVSETVASKYEAEVNRLHSEMDRLERNLFQKSEMADKYSSMLKLVGTAYIKNLTLVAGEKQLQGSNDEYIYIGVSNTMDQLMEWIKFIKPARLVLLQEITARYVWLSLMARIREEKITTDVIFLSQYELINGGTYDGGNN